MDKRDWQSKGAGHRQRLRDKFIAQGIDGFTDAEIIEMLLAMGTPRVDCKEAARAALARFGSLAKVLEAQPGELSRVKGIGEKNAVALRFVHAVARRFLGDRLRQKRYLHSSDDVAQYLLHAMGHQMREVFTVLFLDAEHAIIATKILFEGSLTTNTVYPREVVKEALAHHAAALVIAHNHPSGSLTPSASDRRLTRHLFLACALFEIRLLDHLLIGASHEPYSFADQGIMDQIRAECGHLLA